MDSILEDLKQAVIEGNSELAASLAEQALDANIQAQNIMNDAMMSGVNIVGDKFTTGEFFLPQLMLTGRALKAALAVIEPALKNQYLDGSAEPDDVGVVVLATIQSDLHDIGKNVVSSMLTASGFEVHDLGVDVPLKTIIAKAEETKADIIAVSSLLTTTMPFMRDLIELLKAAGKRENYKVIVGGASVTPEYATEIGADGTAENAGLAVKLARRIIRQKKEASIKS